MSRETEQAPAEADDEIRHLKEEITSKTTGSNLLRARMQLDRLIETALTDQALTPYAEPVEDGTRPRVAVEVEKN